MNIVTRLEAGLRQFETSHGHRPRLMRMTTDEIRAMEVELWGHSAHGEKVPVFIDCPYHQDIIRVPMLPSYANVKIIEVPSVIESMRFE